MSESIINLINLAAVVVPILLYLRERDRRIKAETDLKVVVKRRGLDEISKDLDNTRPDYDSALGAIDRQESSKPGDVLRNLRTGREVTIERDIWPERTNEDNMSSGPLQGAAQASEPPKFFKGIASEDLREGQEVDITVDPTTGTTRVTSKTASPPFTSSVGPSEQ
jgi:hypothetical protein